MVHPLFVELKATLECAHAIGQFTRWHMPTVENVSYSTSFTDHAVQ
jgi:hypothetical protein